MNAVINAVSSFLQKFKTLNAAFVQNLIQSNINRSLVLNTNY